MEGGAVAVAGRRSSVDDLGLLREERGHTGLGLTRFNLVISYYKQRFIAINFFYIKLF